jgi:hypothetical protein
MGFFDPGEQPAIVSPILAADGRRRHGGAAITLLNGALDAVCTFPSVPQTDFSPTGWLEMVPYLVKCDAQANKSLHLPIAL